MFVSQSAASTVSAKPTVIGTPASGTSGTITLPTHAVGDIIIIGSFRSATGATKPAAGGTVPTWVDIDAPAAANSVSYRSAYAVATATNHTSGSWVTSALCVIVLRGQKAGTPIGGHAIASGTTTNSPNAPSVTLTNADGSSFLLHIYGHAASSGFSAVPAGYTRHTATTQITAGNICLNSKAVTTSDGAIVQTDSASGSTGYFGNTIEILAI